MTDTNQKRTEAMAELEAQKAKHQKTDGPTEGSRRHGLLIVNTGNGKGKTTAALGLMVRAKGRGLRVSLFQFVKHSLAMFGEHRSLTRLEVPFQGLGDGFTWRSKDLENSAAMAEAGWALAKTAIQSGEWDMIVLDEFTYALKFGWVAWDDVKTVLMARDSALHIVITGRDAPPELIELADTVTEMQPVKHAFDAGIKAQAGIEH